MEQEIDAVIEKALPEIIKIRKQFHKNPELGFQEYQTSRHIAQKLQELNYRVELEVGKTGITAIIDSGKPGKAVGIRADMDALPLQEETHLNFTSVNNGKMHACGHDGHMATLLLVAEILHNLTHTFTGKIKLIFQPAEELGLGAKEMIKDGVLKNPPLDAIFGYHNLPTFKKNQIYVKPECIMAGRLVFNIKITGTGGHSSTPEKAVNPIYIASCIVPILHNIRSLNISAFEKMVLAVTRFNAGSADNIIPTEASLGGTIRYTTNKLAEYIKEKITSVVSGIAQSLGGSAEILFPEDAPATINTPEEAELVYQTAVTLFGSEKVTKLEDNIMASEDFSYFLNEIPGCFVLIGTGVDKPYLHSPNYFFDDEVLPVAAKLLAMTAINYLNQT